MHASIRARTWSRSTSIGCVTSWAGTRPCSKPSRELGIVCGRSDRMPLRIGFRGSIAGVSAALSLVTLGIAFAIISTWVNRSQERQFDDALMTVAEAEALDL